MVSTYAEDAFDVFLGTLKAGREVTFESFIGSAANGQEIRLLTTIPIVTDQMHTDFCWYISITCEEVGSAYMIVSIIPDLGNIVINLDDVLVVACTKLSTGDARDPSVIITDYFAQLRSPVGHVPHLT